MSEKQLSEWVTKSEYARYRGVTPIYVSRWIERDKVPTKDGKLEVEVADRYWHKRPQSRQKKIDFDEARTKKMEADARLAEMSADTMASQLVETASVVETWERSFAKIKTKMTALPNKMGPILAVQDDPKICTNQLKNAINKILNELASNARRRNTRRAKSAATG
jgi:DNA-binding transcriptional regulator YiaG